MKKSRHKLINMDIREVSVVKSPANSQPFLFMKSDDENEKNRIIKLDGPVTVTFESNGKAKGTSIVVNGVGLKKVDSFSLYYSKPGDEGIDGPAVSISYSRKKEEDGGFKGIETYWLTKNENKGDNLMNEQFVDVMKKLSGKDDYSYVRKEESEDATEAIQKALDTISTYSEDMPEELRDSVVTLSEYAASAVPVEKQEDETNADTEKVEKDDSEKEEKDEKVEKSETEKSADEKVEKKEKTEDDLAKGTEEILTAVKELKEVVAKSNETMKDIDSRLETVEKSTGARKSVKGQKVEKEDGVAFPSLLDS